MSAADRSLDVARDLLQRSRIRLVDEPDAKGLDAEIVAFLANKTLREDDEPRPSLYSAEPCIAWRGSASDFATDMRSVIAPEKLAEIVTILADKTLDESPREYTHEENFAALKRRAPRLSFMNIGEYDRAFLGRLDRKELRRALWYMRRQDARPQEANPAAAQYDGLATAGSVRAEYRRRGWKIPKPTNAERA